MCAREIQRADNAKSLEDCMQHSETWYNRRAKQNPLSGWMTSGVACRNHSSRPVLRVNFCVRNTEFSELKIEMGANNVIPGLQQQQDACR